MASSKAPKHDFAPAWLKIPDQESLKSSGSKLANEHADKTSRPSRRDDYYSSRYGPPPEYAYPPLQRHRSFDNYYEERRYSPQKFRHHSVDEEYYNSPYGYGYYNNGYSFDKYGSHYRSQPSLYRDGKYTHPNARYNQVNGGYPPYYDPYAYEYYHGDPYFNYMRQPPSSKRAFTDKDTKHNGAKSDKENIMVRGRESGKVNPPASPKDKPMEEEDFPCLNGETEPTDSPSNKLTSGAWEKPPNTKTARYSFSSPSEESYQSTIDGHVKEPSPSRQCKNTNNIYKSLVPNKGSLMKKSNKEGLQISTGNKEVSSAGKPSTPSGTYSSPFVREGSKENARQSPTPPIDILNTRLVTQPKNLADKKSDFLKALRRENSDKPSDLSARNVERNRHKAIGAEGEKNGLDVSLSGTVQEEDVVNGINDLSMDSPQDTVLSSSLEAEQRLLREMGWNEADNEDYVITEEEMKEFERISKEIKQKEQRNGFKRSLPKMWSPQHNPLLKASLQEMNDTFSSSSDSDSDLE